MADITNPQAIDFCNDRARPLAKKLLKAIQASREFDLDYGAQAGDTLFPNTADLVADGSENDGRPRVQAQVVRALRTQAIDLLTWAATGNPTRETRLRSIIEAD
jgi:hypothetical protein